MNIIEPPPQNPPPLTQFLEFSRVLLTENSELQELIHKANKDYFYWTDIKYRVPAGVEIKAEVIWAYLKLGRNANRKITPIQDKDNHPFTFWIPDGLHRAISEVDKWSGGILTVDNPSALPAKERYIISSLMDEAIASSQLEGASTEYRVAKELLRSGRDPKDINEKMIVNNWKAMQYIRENIQRKFSIDKLYELQTVLTLDTLEHPEESGKLRIRDDIFVEYRNEVVHIPPKATMLPERMRRLCEFANNDDEDNWVHPVIKGAMIHFWLAYDHPFTDGNGRTARALMYWYLLSRGYSLFEYLSISKHFLRAPGQYVRAYLYTENDENDLTYFLVYNLAAVRVALDELRNYLKRKQKEIVKANQILNKIKGLNMRQKSLVYHSIQHPDTIYTIEAHRNTHGVGYDTARKDLVGLAKKGFLKQEREGKRLFLFTPTEKVVEKIHQENK